MHSLHWHGSVLEQELHLSAHFVQTPFNRKKVGLHMQAPEVLTIILASEQVKQDEEVLLEQVAQVGWQA